MMSILKEFKINEYLSVVLEWNPKMEKSETLIYISGERFLHCKSLFLKVPLNKESEKVDSIDDAVGRYGKLSDEEFYERFGLTPEIVFWAHCSNLQTWAEYNYDTRLLHSNLSFPLLEKLKDLGDIKAQDAFKKEIILRYKEGTEDVRELLRDHYLRDIPSEELLDLYLIKKHQDVLKEMEREYGKSLFNINYILDRKINELHFHKKIPESVKKLKDSIKKLSLTNVAVPDWIDELQNLESFYLNRFPDAEFPESVTNLPKLKFLTIKHSPNLKSLPKSFLNLKNLTSLTIYNGHLKNIPSTIGKLKNLKKISISQNKLDKIPSTIGDLKNLEDLRLNSNRLKQLPSTLRNLKNLKRLWFCKNEMEILPEWVLEFESLESINVDNRIKEKNKKIFKILRKRQISILST